MIEVWSIEPEEENIHLRATFDHSRWQFAEKLARLLRDRGHRKVSVRIFYE